MSFLSKKSPWMAALLVCASAQAAEKAFVRGVGSGLLFPAASQALLVNPAGLDETSKITVAGLYRVDSKDPYASGVFRLGRFAAVGAAYHQEGTTPLYKAGLGLKLSAIRLGATFKNTNMSSGFNADAGFILNLKNFRIGAVARDVNGRISRIDSGIGFRLSTMMIEVNAKKSYPYDDNQYLVDLGISTMAAGATLGFGYDANYNPREGGLSNGHFHAGVSLGIKKTLFLEAFYRPLAQEWTSSEWAAGLRLML